MTEGSNFNNHEYEGFRYFGDWLLNINNDSLKGISLQSTIEPNWIEIPLEFLITNEIEHVNIINLSLFLLDTMMDITCKNIAY